MADSYLGRQQGQYELVPILIVQGVKNAKRLKAFLSGDAPKDHYQDIQVYFERNPLHSAQIFLVFRKGKQIDSISIDYLEHMLTLVGMVRCRKIFFASPTDSKKVSTITFDISAAVDQFEQKLKDKILEETMQKKLKADGKDPSLASSLAPKFWAAFEQKWEEQIQQKP